LFDRQTGSGRHLRPDIAGTPRQAPAIAPFLAGDSDKAEIPDRSAIGAWVFLDHGDALAGLGRHIGMGKADHTAAHHRQVEGSRRHGITRGAPARISSGPGNAARSPGRLYSGLMTVRIRSSRTSNR